MSTIYNCSRHRLTVIIESIMDYSHANSCLITCTLLLILSDWSLPIIVYFFFNIKRWSVSTALRIVLFLLILFMQS